MSLQFIDVHGFSGVIKDDLSVSYDGPSTIEEAIESVIDDIESEIDETEDQFESLLIELGDVELVQAVGRLNGDADSGGPRPSD